MKKEVFISWSGKKSKEIASKIKSWLPEVIPDIDPWMSEDIQAGVRWSPEIAEKLSRSKLGIICVTCENIKSQWLLFEAGAISKELDNDTRVCPVLIDISLSKLQYPLAQFQAIELTPDGQGILKLVSSLNEITDHPFPSSVVEILFEHHWPHLKEQVFGPEGLLYSKNGVYHFYNINDQIFLEDLFKKIDYEEITSIDIMGHTGENLIRGFLSILENNKELTVFLKEKEVIIRVLLRDPISEVSGRVLGITRTLGELQEFQRRGLKIYLHFYQNLPIFRSILFRHKKPDIQDSDNQKGFITFYYFPPDSTSKRYPQRLLVNYSEDNKDNIIEIHNSWFDYFWGKSRYREIHTIIFDFDDTIVESHPIQIEAWVELIKYAIEVRKIRTKELEGMRFENDEIKIEDKAKLRKDVKRIFFENQIASEIFNKIFPDEMDKDLKNELHQKRFQIRQSKMDEVEMFSGAAETIRKISGDFNLVIISATDENMIKDYLSRPDFIVGHNPLYACFKYVFGKREHDFKWQNVDRKSQLIHKITSIIGVPVERMVYIGDNNGDFVASSRININFIEARLFSDEVEASTGRESLIFDTSRSNTDEKFCFTSWKGLCEILERVEKYKQKCRKERYGF